MLVCNCTLPYSNPEACKNCSQYLEYHGNHPYDPFPNRTPPLEPNPLEPKTYDVKKTTRTIEKYDEEGQLIGKEVITEEEEIYQKPAYYYTTTDYIVDSSKNSSISFSTKEVVDQSKVIKRDPTLIKEGCSEPSIKVNKSNFNYIYSNDSKIPEPPPPTPPLSRIIIERTIGDCPNCGSSTKRKPIIFGRKFCINEKCTFHVIPIEQFIYRFKLGKNTYII